MQSQQSFSPQHGFLQHGTRPGYPQSQQPRLMYFITRSNGTIVPLLPVDELPYSVRLEGVSRNMPPEQTAGMQFLGALPYTGSFFRTKDDSTAMQRSSSQPNPPAHQRQYSNGKQYMAPDALARQATANASQHSHSLSMSNPSTPNRTGAAHGTSSPLGHDAQQTAPISDPQAIIDAIVSTKSGSETAARIGYIPRATTTAPPSGKIPEPNKKTHCSYWIRTGECDYAQQGCMYKHEILDEKGLLELGFRSTPRWWLERNQPVKFGAGNAISGKRATVGPVVKPSEWLRRQSGTSSETEDSAGSETEVESVKSDGKENEVPVPVKVQQKDSKEAAKGSRGQEKQIAILKKPTVQKPAPKTSMNKAATLAKPTDTGNLIDFGPSDTTTSSPTPSPTPTTPTAASSPQSSTAPSRASGPATSPNPKSNPKVFVPKGESPKTHIAEHLAHHHPPPHQRSRSLPQPTSHTARPQSRATPKPSEAQIAHLDAQIQQASKSKHGLMASKHAPAPEKGGRRVGAGKEGGRTAMGLRVRRPAVQCVEIPTGRNLRARAEAKKVAKEEGCGEKGEGEEL